MRKQLIAVSALAFALAAGAGAYSANVQANAEVDWANDFKIVATSVRLGDGSVEDPTGLRFMVNCPVDYSDTAEDVKCYTLLTLTPAGGTQKTVEVPATVWRPEGGIGWNTVVLGIPTSDYLTEITATSYVKVGENDPYASNTVTYSMAKTASLYMQQNNITNNETLNAFVAGSVSEITLDKTEATVVEGDAVQLSATTDPEGFGVTYSSSDESVATVDNTGKVVMQKASGSATITASMGGATKDFTVTSGGMATTLHFDNGVNNYITAIESDDSAVCVGPRASAEENVAAATATGTLKYDPGDWTFVMGFDAAYLANVFADSAATDLEFKMYTNRDGIANIKAGGDSLGAPFKVGSTTDSAVEVWSGYTMTDMGDYLLMKLPKSLYTDWLGQHTNGTTADTFMKVQMRLGRLDTDATSATYNKIVWGAVDHIYIDDVVVNVRDTSLDPIVGYTGSSTGDTTVALVERVAGDTAMQVTKTDTQVYTVFGIDAAWLAEAFADTNTTAVSFKLYTEYTTYVTGGSNNNSFVKDTAGELQRTDWQVMNPAPTYTDGYFTYTVSRAEYEIWFNCFTNAKNVSGTAINVDTTSAMYLSVGLKDASGTAMNSGSFYIDDLVAVK